LLESGIKIIVTLEFLSYATDGCDWRPSSLCKNTFKKKFTTFWQGQCPTGRRWSWYYYMQDERHWCNLHRLSKPCNFV